MFDADMLNIRNLNYNSNMTILFMRLSVIVSDIVFAIGVKRFASFVAFCIPYTYSFGYVTVVSIASLQDHRRKMSSLLFCLVMLAYFSSIISIFNIMELCSVFYC